MMSRPFTAPSRFVAQAHALEARTVVRQALDILTPAMPERMEDGNYMLTHWTRKIIVEEGHTLAQLMHVLQVVVRHHKVTSVAETAPFTVLCALLSIFRSGFLASPLLRVVCDKLLKILTRT